MARSTAARQASPQARQPAHGGDARQHALEALLDDAGPDSWRTLHPYAKWRGVFWRVASAVDLGFSTSDVRAVAMVDRVLDWLTSEQRLARVRTATVDGRVRWCASQDGLGLWTAVRLGRASDPRAGQLAAGLVSWQWPDGGWNCDKRPATRHSSFHETHGPLRGLAAYHEQTGDGAAGAAAQRAAAFLLAHDLYRSCRTGQVAHPEFAKLHWPPYWHYDILVGLRGVAAAGCLRHQGAQDALGVLEAARRPDGTWRTGGRRYWRPPGRDGSGVEVTDLSQAGRAVVTAQASALLGQAAG